MSAFGTKRTSQCAQPMSAFGVKRTMTQVSENVRFWSSAFLAAHQTTAKIDTHDKIARVFLGRARRRKRPIWHLISIRGRKLELKRPPLAEFTRRGLPSRRPPTSLSRARGWGGQAPMRRAVKSYGATCNFTTAWPRMPCSEQ